MTSSTTAPRPLLILQRTPYGGSLARSALDVALSYAVFNQRPQILFSGAGVLQLGEGQSPAGLGLKSLRKVIDSFPLYDIEEILVDRESLQQYGLAAAALPDFARLIDRSQTRVIVQTAMPVLSF
ncbi:MAG: tRNA 2-thiouridine synthesizing protein C [Halieaceae bacterium]|jgi:tRNA 2-thiouridine synthesizing protein C